MVDYNLKFFVILLVFEKQFYSIKVDTNLLFFFICLFATAITWRWPKFERKYLHTNRLFSFCSDFRYESNGMFVLGVGFFSSDIFRLFN